ncbi:uncharacterized protein LOC131045367 [Cryptomeria japonica]|uniref:uncharacterized protein LOC131045367 n=1 Tax=Cryptomeria japonica TaxID=3369 RepID=UPI0025AC6E1E|nr:uncharacterized protein LOC131045367 [Cryptomeria japonica]
MPQLLVTLAKRGTRLPTLPKDSTANNQVGTPDLSSSNVSKSVSINSKLVSDVSTPFNLKYQPFDIIDHTKKTKIQMSEVEYLKDNPEQFDRLAKFVKEKEKPQVLVVSQNNLVDVPSIVSAPVTSHKILRVGYYCHTLFQDTYDWVGKCDLCQQFVGKSKLTAFPLNLVIIEEPFQQWGVDFIGPINPPSNAGHHYVLTAMDYFTKWVEAVFVKHTTSETVCDFIKENIVSRFGVPNKIVAVNATYFSSYEITQFFFEYHITLAHSSDYYPQCNDQAKSSNKSLIAIIENLVHENQHLWHKALINALWVDRITPKRAIGLLHFQLLHGTDADIPITL